VRTLAAILAVALAVIMVGCEEERSTDAPMISDMEAERARVAATVKKRQSQQQAAAKAAPEKPGAGVQGKSVLDTAMGTSAQDYVYDARDKRDPFRSTFWERRSVSRKVLGPLEQFELGQLSVTAIVWETNRPRALVTDPHGLSYVVREGSQVGKNEGLVIHIGDNLVLVKETYIDFAGEESTKDVEMRIRRSQGG
jgi:type IV pilus assembly protein PilP